MDDDALNRREAVTGLGFLGALMLALVGVIVFRIVSAKPQAPRTLDRALMAAAPAVPVDEGTSTRTLDFDESVEAKAASPIPIAAESGGNSVPLASGIAPAPQSPPTGQQATEAAPVARPVFVAPGSGASPSPR